MLSLYLLLTMCRRVLELSLSLLLTLCRRVWPPWPCCRTACSCLAAVTRSRPGTASCASNSSRSAWWVRFVCVTVTHCSRVALLQSISQSIFYFMSVHVEVILDIALPRLCHRQTLFTCRSASSVSPSDIAHVSLYFVCVTVRHCSRVAPLTVWAILKGNRAQLQEASRSLLGPSDETINRGSPCVYACKKIT